MKECVTKRVIMPYPMEHRQCDCCKERKEVMGHLDLCEDCERLLYAASDLRAACKAVCSQEFKNGVQNRWWPVLAPIIAKCQDAIDKQGGR